jgi:two-component system, OmpR family, heavy metal sensor histidine kinase CusS
MALNIRWRLTLWNLLTLAIVLLAFSALVYGLVARSLYQRLDHTLLSELEELEHKPDQNLSHWISEAKEHENISSIVYDSDGKVYERTEELPMASVEAFPRPAGAAQHFADVALPILGRQRSLTSSFRSGDRQFTIALLASLDEVDRELAQLLRVLGTAVPIALIGAGAFGYLLARKSLAPMKRLHRLTAEITVDRLDHRLPVDNADDELGQLTQTINAMIGRLERSVAEIRRFTADASHELRTPLTAIRTEAEIALRKPLDTQGYHDLLGSILEECDRLTRMTEQLLTLAREDAGNKRLDVEPVDLGSLLDSVVETMRPLAEVKEIRLTCEGNIKTQVSGEASRLRQVFCNLLDNAIKYTPEGGIVEVQFEEVDHFARVIVRDSGIGIAPEHLPRVFDRFYRVDKARTRAEGGTGLGLSIAQSIVAAHGGRIELASTRDEGTMCTVFLPMDPGHGQQVVARTE